MNIIYGDNVVTLENPENFNIEKTFECGQCFRWEKRAENEYIGIALGKVLKLTQKDKKIVIENIDKESFDKYFLDYFDLYRNYESINIELAKDEILKKAVEEGNGIRILKQDPFETIISFIVSSNNNIPRIKKIIKAFCESYGEKIIYNEVDFYSFPTPKTIFSLSVSDLAPFKMGYRDKYILDAAQKVHSKEVDIKKIFDLNYEDAKRELLKIKGIGDKVADCILLFSYGKMEAFPKDVWMKRVLADLYNSKNEKDIEFFGFPGIAQQYLYYYIREKDKSKK